MWGTVTKLASGMCFQERESKMGNGKKKKKEKMKGLPCVLLCGSGTDCVVTCDFFFGCELFVTSLFVFGQKTSLFFLSKKDGPRVALRRF